MPERAFANIYTREIFPQVADEECWEVEGSEGMIPNIIEDDEE